MLRCKFKKKQMELFLFFTFNLGMDFDCGVLCYSAMHDTNIWLALQRVPAGQNHYSALAITNKPDRDGYLGI